jgi:Ca-activated chloride channel family protein
VTPLATTGMKAETFKTVDGKSGWRVQIPGGRALATPAVVDDTIYVGGGFGSHEFYAFDAKSGAPRWAITVSDDGPTAAVVSGGRVIFNTESCTLFVVDAKTGKMIWSRWLGDPLMSQPAVSGGVVYMAFPGAGGHQLIALKLEDGKQLWQAPIAGDIISAPVIDGDSIYLSTNDGTVYRHKLSNGQLDWKKELHATSAPWVAADGVHVSQGEALNGHGKQEGFRTLASDGRVTTGLQGGRDATWLDANQNAQSGYATKQKADDSSVGFSSAPATAQTAEASANLGQATVRGLWEFQGSRPLIVDTHNYNTQGDRVRALDGDGILLWEKKLAGDLKAAGGALGAPPSYAGGKLVVATTTGDITGYEAASGKELFRYPLGQEIRFQPALVKGRIVIGSATGVLTSIDTTDASLDKWTMWGGGPKHNGPE